MFSYVDLHFNIPVKRQSLELETKSLFCSMNRDEKAGFDCLTNRDKERTRNNFEILCYQWTRDVQEKPIIYYYPSQDMDGFLKIFCQSLIRDLKVKLYFITDLSYQPNPFAEVCLANDFISRNK